MSPHFAVTGRNLDPGILQGKIPFEEQSGITRKVQQMTRENLIEAKEQNVKRHNEQRNTVHLPLKPGDTVLVRLQKKKTPETDQYVVTKVSGKEITATNQNTGRSIKRHLCRFTKVADEKEAPKLPAANNEEKEEEENDVNPQPLLMGVPLKLPQDVRQNVGDGRIDKDRAQQANPDLQPGRPTLSPKRTTRHTT